MKNRHAAKQRPIWKRLVGIGVVTAFIFAIVAGIQYTVAWAGSGYDYNGNEVRQALPVAATGTDSNKDSAAQVVVADNGEDNQTDDNADNEKTPSDNADNNDTGGKVMNTNTGYVPGSAPAVNVTSSNTSYPQTGEVHDAWVTTIGYALVLGASVVIFTPYVGKSRREEISL